MEKLLNSNRCGGTWGAGLVNAEACHDMEGFAARDPRDIKDEGLDTLLTEYEAYLLSATSVVVTACAAVLGTVWFVISPEDTMLGYALVTDAASRTLKSVVFLLSLRFFFPGTRKKWVARDARLSNSVRERERERERAFRIGLFFADQRGGHGEFGGARVAVRRSCACDQGLDRTPLLRLTKRPKTRRFQHPIPAALHTHSHPRAGGGRRARAVTRRPRARQTPPRERDERERERERESLLSMRRRRACLFFFDRTLLATRE